MKLSSRGLSTGIAGVVVLSFVVLLVAQRVPQYVRASSTDLSGAWRWRAAELGDGAAPNVDDSAWATVQLPGALVGQGVAPEAWLRRWVELPVAVRGQEHFVVLGDTRSSFVEVWVNGHFVGLDGEVRRRLKTETTTLQGYVLPAALMTGERVLIALKVTTAPNPGWEGINDRRFLVGPSEPVHAWFLRAVMLDNLLNTSPILLSMFLMVLLGVLLVLEGKRGDQRRYLAVIAFIGACVLWQITRNGMLLLDVVPRRTFHYYATLALVLTGVEQAEYSFTGRLGRWIVATRMLVACCAGLPFFPYSRVTGAIMLGLCVPVSRTLFLAGRSLLRGPKGLNGLMDVGVLLLAVSGVNDLLSYLNVITTPHVFGLGVNYLALISATVVIGDFISISGSSGISVGRRGETVEA
jgi:hypothetical protein